MARIRSIKPEFWASPSVARASAVSRLAFIAMWNWADDHGRGTANLKELEGFIFPNDDVAELSSGNTAHFRDVVQEVATCFDVLFYEADGRPFYAIPTWDDHQRNERRSSSSKHPDPTDIPAFSWLGAEIPSQDTVNPNISGTGTGEQGNRGTGEQDSSSEVANAPNRPEIMQLFGLLNSEIVANGGLPAKATKKNLDATRLMLDRDGRTVEQVTKAIQWSQGDEFWRSNILSMSKLREKFDQLRLAAARGSKPKLTNAEQNLVEFKSRYGGGDGESQGDRAIAN